MRSSESCSAISAKQEMNDFHQTGLASAVARLSLSVDVRFLSDSRTLRPSVKLDRLEGRQRALDTEDHCDASRRRDCRCCGRWLRWRTGGSRPAQTSRTKAARHEVLASGFSNCFPQLRHRAWLHQLAKYLCAYSEQGTIRGQMLRRQDHGWLATGSRSKMSQLSKKCVSKA